MVAANRIYQGPQDRQPKTISDRTAGAGGLLPGTWVSVLIATIVQTATITAVRAALLGDRDFYSDGQMDANDPLKVAYASGDTAVVYVPEPGQRYLMACAAATYTNGQELVIAAAGRVAGAGAAGQVIGFYDGPNGVARAAGDLIEVVVANTYTKT